METARRAQHLGELTSRPHAGVWGFRSGSSTLGSYQLADLATYPRAAVVVEERYSAVFKHEHVAGGWLADLLARHQVRYPTVPIVFCETRPLAEEWTFRFLGTALAHHLDQPTNPTAPWDLLGPPQPSDTEQ